MSEASKFKTREEWLAAATALFAPTFKSKGSPLPTKLRVSVGWPHKSGTAASNRRIGECWTPDASADKTTEIFISPFLSEEQAEQGILSTLLHELVHAAVGIECGHKGPFKKLALALGLTGKMTATVAGPDLMETLAGMAEDLGPMPHAKLDMSQSPRKTQGTRLIKCKCEACGHTVRDTKKWLTEIGAPICPCNNLPMTFKMPEDESSEDDGGSDDE